jgi:hypothetical protein
MDTSSSYSRRARQNDEPGLLWESYKAARSCQALLSVVLLLCGFNLSALEPSARQVESKDMDGLVVRRLIQPTFLSSPVVKKK